MPKIDYKKEFKHLYKPSAKEVIRVYVPPFNYLMVDGQGDPNTSLEFQQAIEVLYPVAYTLKFMIKKGPRAIDYGVMPLEGLWWAEDMSKFSTVDKDEWFWTLMIMQPELVTTELFEIAIKTVAKKKNPATLAKLRFEQLNEGAAAQIMHLGPFSEEGPTVEKVHNFIRKNGFQLCGKHHEIYLSDIRKTAPEKLKTIIRQPF